MDVGVIINPISGGSRRVSIADRVTLAEDALRMAELDGEVVVTERRAHGGELARSFVERGVGAVVVWGGDGTINEVASEVAFRGPALGIVPGGSGNGLARELGLPRDPGPALRIALRGRPRSIDVGELGGRLFFNVAGVGFDALLADRFNARTTRGPLGYFVSTCREVLTYESNYYVLRASDVAISQTALIVALANTRQYGNDAQIAPLARLDDGLLELVVLPALDPLVALWHARRLFSGTIHKVPGVKMQSIRQVQIASDTLDIFHVDGEVVPAPGPLSASVHPQALPVRVPDA
jgi:YegS/Rv2252/BmrU family lipid kinase